MIADGQAKRQSVLYDHGISADIGLATDATELMYAGIGADVSAVRDRYVTCQGGRIRHDHVIANQAIVRDVCLGHEKAVLPNPGDPAAARSAAMHGNEFADARAASDLGLGLLARELQIPRRQ